MNFEINDRIRVRKGRINNRFVKELGGNPKTLYVVAGVSCFMPDSNPKEALTINLERKIVTLGAELFKKISSPGKRLGKF